MYVQYVPGDLGAVNSAFFLLHTFELLRYKCSKNPAYISVEVKITKSTFYHTIGCFCTVKRCVQPKFGWIWCRELRTSNKFRFKVGWELKLKPFCSFWSLLKNLFMTDFKATAVAAETNSAKFGVDASFDTIVNILASMRACMPD